MRKTRSAKQKKPDGYFMGYEHALLVAAEIAEQARMDRPEKPPGSHRRRVGDVIRWKANNLAVDQIIADLRVKREGE